MWKIVISINRSDNQDEFSIDTQLAGENNN